MSLRINYLLIRGQRLDCCGDHGCEGPYTAHEIVGRNFVGCRRFPQSRRPLVDARCFVRPTSAPYTMAKSARIGWPRDDASRFASGSCAPVRFSRLKYSGVGLFRMVLELWTSEMIERLGNFIYWLCLVAAVVLVIVGIMTFAAIGGRITQTWTIFGGWALVAAATYGVGWLVRFFTFRV